MEILSGLEERVRQAEDLLRQASGNHDSVCLEELSHADRAVLQRIVSGGPPLNAALVKAAKTNPRARAILMARVLLAVDMGLGIEDIIVMTDGALSPEDIVGMIEEWRKSKDRVNRLCAESAGNGTAATDSGNADPEKDETPEAAGVVDKALSLDDLIPTAWKLLESLPGLNAFNSGKAVSRDKIAAAADVGNADSHNTRAAFGALKDLRLIGTRRRVGTWITQAGLDALKSRP
jgi:hypothetical protein